MTHFYSVADMVEDFNNQIQEFLDEHPAVKVTTKELGLDDRSFYGEMFIADRHLFVKNKTGSLDYYGGFEYVSKSAVTQVGDWTIYNAEEDERIEEHVSRGLGEEPEVDDE